MVVLLSNNKRIYTEKMGVSYKVLKGSVQIFLTPANETEGMRQMFLLNAGPGFVIPYLNMNWGVGEKQTVFRLMVMGAPSAQIEEVPSDLQHDVDFLEAAKIPYFDEPSPYLLADTLLMHYSRRNVSERKIVNDISKRRDKETTESLENFVDSFEKTFVGKYSANSKTESALYNAVAFVCTMSKIPIAKLSDIKKSCGDNFVMKDVSRLSGFACREVNLPDKWEKEDMNPFIVLFGEERTPLACYRHFGKIRYWNPETKEEGVLKNIMKKPEESEIYVLSKPLSTGQASSKDILKFALAEIRPIDVVTLIVATFLATFATLQMTVLSEKLYNEIIPQGSSTMLIGVAIYIFAFMMGGLMFNVSKSLANFRISSRIKYALYAASYDRLFHMKNSYFRNRTSADIAYRVEMMPNIYVNMITSAISVITTLVFSTMFVMKMLRYSSRLTAFSMIFIFINLIFSMVLGFASQKLVMKKASFTAKLRELLLQTFSGIATVRNYGSEDDFSNRFMNMYSEYNQLQFKSDFITRVQNLAVSATSYAAIVIFYLLMGQGNLGISTGIFLAFVSAYASYSASMMQVASNILLFIIMRPVLKSTSDIFKEIPETAAKGVVPGELQGEIVISNVSYAYRKGGAPVLKNIDLKIPKGQYVAIVGPSGCGKSTLLKLLLGFDSPSQGKIFYDGIDLERINKVEFRRKIGTVMQDGALFSGSIYNNISIACPTATEEDVLEASEVANLRETIEKMPLGFSTPVSEQSDFISGGQKQRIMIARAVVSKPKILFMDEATSALDNISQAIVQKNLDKFAATRVIIAHRLSTVKNCDVIYVMNNGTIIEGGSYDELMEKKGAFYNLVQKQII
ncbi:MAG: ATP-binding cassette domain-containing protein [Anaerovoracaceae bacterium]